MAERTGDPFRAFYDRALPAVFGYLQTRLSDPQRVEDLTRDVFRTIVVQWPFPANIHDEVAFAVGTARQKLVEEYRNVKATGHVARLAGDLLE